ncbi:sugar ABC transporter substrate-binding protein [Nakamurella panacisegetis]|uniref:sugar ABC transporter substrate-binding protein n=1 Tax=Nakamurella panacisegetis TaxID=1090615 RepID=UPI0012FE1921|nr:substrate-binding domain-containing protein [Nakamurella panacisegetis]
MTPTGSDAFGDAVTESIAAQIKAAGADLIRCDPGDDPNLVLDCARRLATEHVDAWIVVRPGDVGAALCDVGPKGVPLIAVAASPLSCQTAGVGADDRQAGLLIGRELGGVPRNSSDCARSTLVIVNDSASASVSTERVAGIRAGFSALCPGAAVRVLDAGTQDRAYDAFRAVFPVLPEGILVAAVNDAAALGVVAATPDGRANQVTVAAIGADQQARCEMTKNPVWLGDAALFPDRYGQVAVPALLKALAGQHIPRNLYIQTTFVTPATLGRYYGTGDCPAK